MAAVEKIIEKMKRQPNGIRPEEAIKHYLNKKTGDLITIKQENPLKKAYIVDILNRIEE